jgi:hypothetical protein
MMREFSGDSQPLPVQGPEGGAFRSLGELSTRARACAELGSVSRHGGGSRPRTRAREARKTNKCRRDVPRQQRTSKSFSSACEHNYAFHTRTFTPGTTVMYCERRRTVRWGRGRGRVSALVHARDPSRDGRRTHAERLDFVRQVRAIRAADDDGPPPRFEALVELDADAARHLAEHGVRRRVVENLRDDALDQLERLVVRVLG